VLGETRQWFSHGGRQREKGCGWSAAASSAQNYFQCSPPNRGVWHHTVLELHAVHGLQGHYANGLAAFLLPAAGCRQYCELLRGHYKFRTHKNWRVYATVTLPSLTWHSRRRDHAGDSAGMPRDDGSGRAGGALKLAEIAAATLLREKSPGAAIASGEFVTARTVWKKQARNAKEIRVLRLAKARSALAQERQYVVEN